MKFLKSRNFSFFALAAAAVFLRFYLIGFLGPEHSVVLRILAIFLILSLGIGFVLRKTAKIIEETTYVLSKRTKLAGGLLQSLGTAFPDMVLGIMAALISLSLRTTDYVRAVNFAIIAASTTFGSNIYNVGHAAWCVFRQNLANVKNKTVAMFPVIKAGGLVRPMAEHQNKPVLSEIETSIDVSTALTVLTAMVALGMVLFGKIENPPLEIKGDLYQLSKPVGAVILVLSVFVLYIFRHIKKESELEGEENHYSRKSDATIWLHLLFAGAVILLAAESMVRAIVAFSEITGLPFVVAGILAGVIGCLGEMLVIHNFTVHPTGRLGDAVVGVAMDNIVTIIGAAIVAVMGGIFLGGNALIIIFVVILTLNTILIWQISRLKNYLI